jgi:hypothetical protein
MSMREMDVDVYVSISVSLKIPRAVKGLIKRTASYI